MVVFLNRDLQKPVDYTVDQTGYGLVIMKCHNVLKIIRARAVYELEIV